MKRILVAIALLLVVTPPVWADGTSAVRALAEKGDPDAQLVLGTMYRYGQGVERDFAEAFKWWGSAAESGNVDAQFALGDIYSGGYDVPQDLVRSYMWFDIMAAQTDIAWRVPIARSNQNALAGRMTASEISEAKRLSAEWISRHGK